MFLGSDLVFVELMKTGSSHIRRLLCELPCCDGVALDRHLPISLLSAEQREGLRDKVCVGGIRNPWSWYVSLWAYGCQGEGSVFEFLTGKLATGCAHERAREWSELYADVEDPTRFRRWLRQLLCDRRIELPEGLGKLGADAIGLLTWRYQVLYTEWVDGVSGLFTLTTQARVEAHDRANNLMNRFIRTENLGADLESVLEPFGPTPAERALIHQRERQRSNASRHRDYRAYYDDATIEIVANNDAYLIRKHDYAFES